MPTNRKVSRLYHLAPVGVGTPYVESLESYTRRLAEAHCVTVGSLLSKIILPSLNNGYIRINHLTCSRAKRINNAWYRSDTGLTQEIVSCLEELTGVVGIKNLTFLPLKNYITGNNLLKKTLSWCPFCYQDAVETGRPIYDQLIWTVNCVNICLKHHVKLQDECPICNSFQRILGYSSRNGICQNCGAWLGSSVELLAGDICDGSNEEKSIANYVGEIIEKFEMLSYRKSHFPTNLSSITKQIPISIRKLASSIGVTHQLVSCWMNKAIKPRLAPLLDIGYLLNINPFELLTEEINNNDIQLSINKELISRKVTRRIADRDKIKKELDSILSKYDSISLAECSRIVGHSMSYLRKHFLKETNIITARNNLYQKQIQDKKCDLIERTIDELHEIGILPSRKAIALRLNRRIINSEKTHKVWAGKVASLGYNPLDFH